MGDARKREVLLIHWNASEAEERAVRLRRAGYAVAAYSRQGGEGLRELRGAPPAVVVIDLGRLPSHGRAVATFLRQQKATRRVPIVFAGGAPEKVALARELLPDAIYTEWARIRSALRRALARPPADPVVPGTMAGYSATPLPRKLGLKPATTMMLLGAPEEFESALGALPEEVTVRRRAQGRAELIVLFARSLSELERRFPSARRCMTEKGRLWIAWPKKSSGISSDLGQAAVRAFGLAAGLVDFKICAIDATWSGLCFATRKRR